MENDSARRHWAQDDIGYHSRRANQELEIAQQANCMISRRFHYHLAALHLDRAYCEAPFMERAVLPARRTA